MVTTKQTLVNGLGDGSKKKPRLVASCWGLDLEFLEKNVYCAHLVIMYKEEKQSFEVTGTEIDKQAFRKYLLNKEKTFEIVTSK